MTEQQNQEPLEKDEINLFTYWHIIWGSKKLIGIIFLSAVILAILGCLLSTKIYESTASIIAPESGGATGGLSSTLAATMSFAQNIPGISTPSVTPNRDILVGVLKSRTIQEKIVNQFNLIDYYHRKKIFNLIPMKRIKYIEDATKYLQERTDISVSDEGVILLTVADKNPKMAADIANAYVDYLGQITLQLGAGTASRQRRFIAEQVAKTKNNLKDAEEALKLFQEKHNTVSLDNQTKGAIDAAATLKAAILDSEVQLQVLQKFTKDVHPDVIKLKSRIEELKQQLTKLEYNAGMMLPPAANGPGHFKKEIYLPVVDVPRLGLELARLTRDVKVQESLYNFLMQQLEQIKIDEVRDTPVFQALDHATPANRKSKPKTILVIAIAGFMSVALSIPLLFVLEYIKKQYQKSKQLKADKCQL